MKLSIPMIYLSLLLLASCQEHETSDGNNKILKDNTFSTKQNSQNRSLGTSDGNNEILKDNIFCTEHNIDCGKFAMEMNMSLDEYHKWKEQELKDAQDEDNATDANGDIVDLNESSIEVANSAPPRKYINDDLYTKTKAIVLINGDLMTVKWTNSSGGVSKRDAIRSGKTEIDMIKDERTKFICNDNSGDYFILQDGVSDLIYFYNELGDEYWEINLYREN
jgi:hypothetical protein